VGDPIFERVVVDRGDVPSRDRQASVRSLEDWGRS